METLKFKTNIKCSGCIATVTPFLNKTVGAENWQVDIQAPEKTLTVQAVDKEKEIHDKNEKKAERKACFFRWITIFAVFFAFGSFIWGIHESYKAFIATNVSCT